MRSALLAALLSAPLAPVARVAPVAPAQPLTLKDLQNFVYDLGANSNVEGGKVPLANGKWIDADSGSTFTLHPTHAIGDLDGDGAGDGVAIVVESSGGTGSFYYMFAILHRGGKAVQAGDPEWLGDRTVVQRLAIDRKGVIAIRYVTHADGDAACCPTMKIEDRYRVANGKLVGLVR